VKYAIALACCLGLLCACASNRPDRFYVLSPLPQGAATARTRPARQATLRVKLPLWVDRSEMVLDTSTDGVTILEHERWAAPLSELVTQTLARDLEKRRADLLVADPSVNHGGADINLLVNVVTLTIRRGQQASIEAHWRIVDPLTTNDAIGAEELTAPLAAADYADVAQSLSVCLGLLADRIAGQIAASQ
jgi:uncharacterized lipoprotein YmbA